MILLVLQKNIINYEEMCISGAAEAVNGFRIPGARKKIGAGGFRMYSEGYEVAVRQYRKTVFVREACCPLWLLFCLGDGPIRAGRQTQCERSCSLAASGGGSSVFSHSGKGRPSPWGFRLHSCADIFLCLRGACLKQKMGGSCQEYNKEAKKKTCWVFLKNAGRRVQNVFLLQKKNVFNYVLVNIYKRYVAGNI